MNASRLFLILGFKTQVFVIREINTCWITILKSSDNHRRANSRIEELPHISRSQIHRAFQHLFIKNNKYIVTIEVRV